ncbi:MAG: AbrB/MazE/SpoVT family DNA-binding domain-containing protein [Candidatus Geothermarchaeales archaeon]
MNEVVRMNGKGRVLIPKDARLSLGLSRGSVLTVRVKDGNIILEPLNSRREEKVAKQKGDLEEFLLRG